MIAGIWRHSPDFGDNVGHRNLAGDGIQQLSSESNDAGRRRRNLARERQESGQIGRIPTVLAGLWPKNGWILANPAKMAGYRPFWPEG
jgi:hypothetical protein